jgi:hypothetical protein
MAALLGFFYGKCSAIDYVAIKTINCGKGFLFVSHFNEGKTPWLSRFTVSGNSGFENSSVSFEKLSKLLICNAKV